jgi:hypothetical protein
MALPHIVAELIGVCNGGIEACIVMGIVTNNLITITRSHGVVDGFHNQMIRHKFV